MLVSDYFYYASIWFFDLMKGTLVHYACSGHPAGPSHDTLFGCGVCISTR